MTSDEQFDKWWDTLGAKDEATLLLRGKALARAAWNARLSEDDARSAIEALSFVEMEHQDEEVCRKAAAVRKRLEGTDATHDPSCGRASHFSSLSEEDAKLCIEALEFLEEFHSADEYVAVRKRLEGECELERSVNAALSEEDRQTCIEALRHLEDAANLHASATPPKAGEKWRKESERYAACRKRLEGE